MTKNRAIYKFMLKIQDEQQVELPAYSEVLKVNEQNGNMCLWAIVDVNEKTIVPLKINIYGTGSTIGEQMFKHNYLDSVLMNDGLVWHIFYGF